MVKMVLDRWNGSITSGDTLINSLPAEKWQQEIAPGKNRGIYLLGHLIAVHDDMLVLLDLGQKQHPELFEAFVKSPDKATPNLPSSEELKQSWTRQNEDLRKHFEALQPAQWFEKHTSVSVEDFAKEPHRNKLNIIITRTSHLQYHLGQLRLLA
ncbi:MAG: hypothetical protein JWP27_1992 [Flaviaesturariibacter sp.]|nr:hypothetical protein [Flaviaesturariibacter sp.]